MNTHRCPSPGCPVRVPSSRFACLDHWRSIPKPLRDELWAAYKNHGVLSDQHVAAMGACSDFLKAEAAA